MEYGTESFEGKEILDNLIFEGPKKLVKNWSNIDTWPERLPFRSVESIPGRLPGSAWALSVHPTKITTWVLTMWWVLARDTRVHVNQTSN